MNDQLDKAFYDGKSHREPKLPRLSDCGFQNGTDDSGVLQECGLFKGSGKEEKPIA